MTLEDFYFVSQIVAALGIMASLVFVGLQMRAQARETRLASMAEIMAEYRQGLAHMSSDRELLETLLKTDKVGLANLDSTDLVQVSLVSLSFLRVFEQAYIYRYEGKIDDRTWTSMKGMMSQTFQYRACLDYFVLRKKDFTQVFVDFVERDYGHLLEESRSRNLLAEPADKDPAP